MRFRLTPLLVHATKPHLSTVTIAGAVARLEGVNKPELLPKEFSTVIDVAGFLTEGEVGVDSTPGTPTGNVAWAACAPLLSERIVCSQEKRIKKEIQGLERDKGVKLRVLAQNYPNTPGDHAEEDQIVVAMWQSCMVPASILAKLMQSMREPANVAKPHVTSCFGNAELQFPM